MGNGNKKKWELVFIKKEINFIRKNGKIFPTKRILLPILFYQKIMAQ